MVLFTFRLGVREPHADVGIFTDARGFYYNEMELPVSEITLS